MCGRFTLTADLEFLIERFSIINDVTFDYQPRYNIAPSQQVFSVIRGSKGNRLGQLKWGFVPPWASDPKIGFKMINARAETAGTKPSFQKALMQQRCLILADSFYEWKKEEGTKQPYRILLKNKEPFAFAGLWSIWEGKGEGGRLATCTILTTSANDIMQPLHHRMPVILKKEQEDQWLDPTITDIDPISQLLNQYPDKEMFLHPVSTSVNSPRNEGPELIHDIK